MRKDKDIMQDTGGAYQHKDLTKPPRDDRRTHNDDYLNRDPDFSDTKKDPDLKLSGRIGIARRLVALAMELYEQEDVR